MPVSKTSNHTRFIKDTMTIPEVRSKTVRANGNFVPFQLIFFFNTFAAKYLIFMNSSPRLISSVSKIFPHKAFAVVFEFDANILQPADPKRGKNTARD